MVGYFASEESIQCYSVENYWLFTQSEEVCNVVSFRYMRREIADMQLLFRDADHID